MTRVEGEGNKNLKKKKGTDDFILLGKALSYVDNFLGTVVEQPRCRWKHKKLNRIKTKKFSVLPETQPGEAGGA